MIIHETYCESSYFSLVNGGCLIKINQLLWEILIYYRFINFYFMNKDISVTIYVIELKFAVCIPSNPLGGSVSQNFDLGPSFNFIYKIG